MGLFWATLADVGQHQDQDMKTNLVSQQTPLLFTADAIGSLKAWRVECKGQDTEVKETETHTLQHNFVVHFVCEYRLPVKARVSCLALVIYALVVVLKVNLKLRLSVSPLFLLFFLLLLLFVFLF